MMPKRSHAGEIALALLLVLAVGLALQRMFVQQSLEAQVISVNVSSGECDSEYGAFVCKCDAQKIVDAYASASSSIGLEEAGAQPIYCCAAKLLALELAWNDTREALDTLEGPSDPNYDQAIADYNAAEANFENFKTDLAAAVNLSGEQQVQWLQNNCGEASSASSAGDSYYISCDACNAAFDEYYYSTGSAGSADSATSQVASTITSDGSASSTSSADSATSQVASTITSDGSASSTSSADSATSQVASTITSDGSASSTSSADSATSQVASTITSDGSASSSSSDSSFDSSSDSSSSALEFAFYVVAKRSLPVYCCLPAQEGSTVAMTCNGKQNGNATPDTCKDPQSLVDPTDDISGNVHFSITECTAACQFCGDGIVQQALGEKCDYGAPNTSDPETKQAVTCMPGIDCDAGGKLNVPVKIASDAEELPYWDPWDGKKKIPPDATTKTFGNQLFILQKGTVPWNDKWLPVLQQSDCTMSCNTTQCSALQKKEQNGNATQEDKENSWMCRQMDVCSGWQPNAAGTGLEPKYDCPWLPGRDRAGAAEGNIYLPPPEPTDEEKGIEPLEDDGLGFNVEGAHNTFAMEAFFFRLSSGFSPVHNLLYRAFLSPDLALAFVAGLQEACSTNQSDIPGGAKAVDTPQGTKYEYETERNLTPQEIERRDFDICITETAKLCTEPGDKACGPSEMCIESICKDVSLCTVGNLCNGMLCESRLKPDSPGCTGTYVDTNSDGKVDKCKFTAQRFPPCDVGLVCKSNCTPFTSCVSSPKCIPILDLDHNPGGNDGRAPNPTINGGGGGGGGQNGGGAAGGNTTTTTTTTTTTNSSAQGSGGGGGNTLPVCGDGIVNMSNPTTNVVGLCGDHTCGGTETALNCPVDCFNVPNAGLVQEECDDGNTQDGDGCSSQCTNESPSSSGSAGSSSSAIACIPGTICPTNDPCPVNGVCPGPSSASASAGSQASSASSAVACIPGTICPDDQPCPQNGQCPAPMCEETEVSCTPGGVVLCSCDAGPIFEVSCGDNGCAACTCSSASASSASSLSQNPVCAEDTCATPRGDFCRRNNLDCENLTEMPCFRCVPPASASSVPSASSVSSVLCIPGTICPTGDACPVNGVCPGPSSASASSAQACIPGTSCPNGDICPANGICPTTSSSGNTSSAVACIPGTICPTGGVCPVNGLCPPTSSAGNASSAIACIPGTICPTGGSCPQNGICPPASSAGNASSAQACIPGTSCPNGDICPANGICPASSSASSAIVCIPGTICPTGGVCPVNGLCPPASSAGASSSIACIPGTICPNGQVCPANGICPGVSSASSSLALCIPGTVCPTGDVCPVNGICPPGSSSSASSFGCIPGSICPSGHVCPVNGICPPVSSFSSSSASSASSIICTPGTICPNGLICPTNGICPPNSSSSAFSFSTSSSRCTSDIDCPNGTTCNVSAGVCIYPICGNGVLEAGEACDNGSANGSDGRCSINCRIETFYGSSSSSYGCTPGTFCPNGQICPASGICPQCTNDFQCESLQCGGNGQCQECYTDLDCSGGYRCIDGNCRNPEYALCGNGLIDAGESCDDGNQNNFDDCANDCRRNAGEECSSNAQCETGVCNGGRCFPCSVDAQCAPGQQCFAGNCIDRNNLVAFAPNYCGNGVLEPGEECDLGVNNSDAPGTSCYTDCSLRGNRRFAGDVVVTPQAVIELPFSNLPGGPLAGIGGGIAGGYTPSTVAPQSPDHAPVGDTGPASLAVMAAAAAGGYSYLRRRRR